MSERNNVVKVGGNPVTLVGNEVKVGDTAPDFAVLDSNLKPVKLSDFSGKTVIVTSVLSLDTGTCDLEGKRFNKEASNLGDDVVILTISMDLPFAQARWCGAAGIKNIKVLSDFRDREFGQAYGIYIKESGLLARTIFIVDKKGKVQYIQYVKEASKEPNYDEVLEAAGQLVG